MSIEGVVGYSDVHVWKYAKSTVVGTIHLQIAPDASQQKILNQTTTIFKQVGHVADFTVEITRVPHTVGANEVAQPETLLHR